MKKYGELDLKKLMKDCDLDFAHFTYGKNQCSCCYGPFDMPAKYWRNGKKLSEYLPGTESHNADGKITGGRPREIDYILFKNANNGSGTVTKDDYIKDNTCVGWHMDEYKLEKVVTELSRQLGNDYVVIKPVDASTCIVIWTKETYARDIEREKMDQLVDDVKEKFDNERLQKFFNKVKYFCYYTARYGLGKDEKNWFLKLPNGDRELHCETRYLRVVILLTVKGKAIIEISVKNELYIKCESNRKISEKKLLKVLNAVEEEGF